MDVLLLFSLNKKNILSLSHSSLSTRNSSHCLSFLPSLSSPTIELSSGTPTHPAASARASTHSPTIPPPPTPPTTGASSPSSVGVASIPSPSRNFQRRCDLGLHHRRPWISTMRAHSQLPTLDYESRQTRRNSSTVKASMSSWPPPPPLPPRPRVRSRFCSQTIKKKMRFLLEPADFYLNLKFLG